MRFFRNLRRCEHPVKDITCTCDIVWASIRVSITCLLQVNSHIYWLQVPKKSTWKKERIEIRINFQKSELNCPGLHTQYPGLKEVGLKSNLNSSRDKIKFLRQERLGLTHKNPALREIDLEPSAKTGTYWSKVLVTLYWYFLNWYSLHARLNSHYDAWGFKKRTEFASTTASQPNFIHTNPSGPYKIVSNLRRAPQNTHLKSNSPIAINSTNTHDWSYQWIQHTQWEDKAKSLC